MGNSLKDTPVMNLELQELKEIKHVQLNLHQASL